jgi:hypothetical protein
MNILTLKTLFINTITNILLIKNKNKKQITRIIFFFKYRYKFFFGYGTLKVIIGNL